jgi:hypothetical protein
VLAHDPQRGADALARAVVLGVVHGGHRRALGVRVARGKRHRLDRHSASHELAQLALDEGLRDLRVARENRQDGCVHGGRN